MFLTSQVIADSERGWGSPLLCPEMSSTLVHSLPILETITDVTAGPLTNSTSALVQNIHPLPTTEPNLSPTWRAPYSSPCGTPRYILLKSSSLGHSPFFFIQDQDGWQRTLAERNPDPSWTLLGTFWYQFLVS